MSDIVERLRSFSEADAYEAPWTFGQHVQEAAATITELRKEVERKTAALEWIAARADVDCAFGMHARAALQGETK